MKIEKSKVMRILYRKHKEVMNVDSDELLRDIINEVEAIRC